MVRIYTEEKAKEKLCCNKAGRCIASGCMAWRWMPDEYNDKTQKMDQQKVGYCGLAGKP